MTWTQCSEVKLVFAERRDQAFAGELPCQREADHDGPHEFAEPDPR